MISIIIPSRQEKYLQKTIDSIESAVEGPVEIIVGFDGAPQDIKTNLPISAIVMDEPIGQRALMNRMVEVARGEYILKTDAHCYFSKGFDTQLIRDLPERGIIAPRLLVLDEETWKPKPKPMSSAYCFDTELTMHYHHDWENDDLVNDTMCLQGSCFMLRRKDYEGWGVCDEALGSWGHQGVELGIVAFLNGGKCYTSKNCFYAHLFRHEDREFPYKRDRGLLKKTHDLFLKKFLTDDIIPLVQRYKYPFGWSVENSVR